MYKYYRKVFLWSVLLVVMSINNSYSQKINGATAAVLGAAAIGTAIALAATNEAAKEAVERNMVEWVLANKTHTKQSTFYLSLIKWEAAKREDLNNISVMGFNYHEYRDWQNVLLFICSPGWVNDNGIDFNKVLVYELDKNNFSKILLSYLNITKYIDEREVVDLNSIPAFSNKKIKSTTSIKEISEINYNNLVFRNTDGQKFTFPFNENLLGSDTHTVIDINEDMKIDFNEGDLNLYLKSINGVFKLKRDFLLDVIKIIWSDL